MTAPIVLHMHVAKGEMPMGGLVMDTKWPVPERFARRDLILFIFLSFVFFS